MFATPPTPLKTAPALRARRTVLRLDVRPIAFGNALANSLVEGLPATAAAQPSPNGRWQQQLDDRLNEQLQDQRDFEDSLNDQAHAGFGLRATPKNWDAFNEGLTNTINANQQARQGTAPEGNPGLSPEAIRAAAALQAAYEGYGRPTGERTFITGRDVNNVSEAFYKTHRRAPTPTEAVALGNYNSLSSAHSVGRNRVLAVPNDLSVLDAYGANEEQLAAYQQEAAKFERIKAAIAAQKAEDAALAHYVNNAFINGGAKGVLLINPEFGKPDAGYSMQIRRQQLDAEEEQRQSLSRRSGSGYISSADAPSYSADMRNIWSNPYSPLGKQIGQTALRTFIPSQ